MPALPTGTITFLFTDIEGSTRLLQRLGESGYRAVLERHHELMRAALRAANGHEVHTDGDAFFVVFRSAPDAVGAAVAAQRALAAGDWPHGVRLRVRMGLHTGQGIAGGDDYIGLDVHLAARIAAAGHGGQILLSDATRALVAHALPQGVRVRALGTHRLRDIEPPQRLCELVIDGLLADFPALRTLRGPGTNLPPPRTSFVGRQRELAELAVLLAGSRLVTLVGPGGTGKTRLAVQVAARQLDRFGDGVWLVDLAPITDPGLVPARIASSLRLRVDPAADPLKALADSLHDWDALVVLDNLEQVIQAAPAIARLLELAPGVRVLATSRVPLHLSGEQQYEVAPLVAAEAVTLFVERAGAVRPGFGLDEADAEAVAGIIRRVDGLPLAIELAAGRVKLLPPQLLLDRLQQRLPLLSGGARDLPERQRTLRRTIAWSHELLDTEEQRLFARLAAFRGGWTLASAEAVCGGEVLDGLFALVDSSLVRQEQGRDADPRFQMLETIAEFAAERLQASGEEAQVRRRHAEHFMELAEAAEPHLVGEGQAEWLGRLEREHDNLRAALDWAETVGEADIALRIAAAIWRFWQHRSHFAEARARLERILALPGAQGRTPQRARALGALGGIRYWQGDHAAIEGPYEEAVGIARELGAPRLLARALLDLSYVPVVTVQDFSRQERLLREALAEAPADDRMLQAELWASLALLKAFGQGDPAAGIEPMERAVAIGRELDDRWIVGENLMGLAGLRRLLGQSEAARRDYRAAATVLLDSSSDTALPTAMFGLAWLAGQDGDHEQAAKLLGAVDRIKDEGGVVHPAFMQSGFFGDLEADARGALGAAGYERARADGYSMTPDQVRAYGLDTASPPA